ncbi:MAG: O-antigen polymerase [Burkholderiaceae bacterium]|nr:O-antigen polymerase [Burkholderiaceae bacterium]
MIENIDKLVAIIFSVLILVQAYFVRSIVGTWIFPACLFSLAWFAFTFFPLVILFYFPADPRSIAYIFLCVSFFSLSALPFNWSDAFKENRNKNKDDSAKLSSSVIHGLLYFSTIAAIAGAVISVKSNGFSLSSMVFNLLETSGEYAVMRGQGDLDYGNWGRLSIVFTYIAPVLGGLIYYDSKKRLKKLFYLFVSFLPSLFIMLTQSAKLIFFLAMGFFFAAMLVRRIYDNQLKLITPIFFVRMAGVALLVFPLLAISFLSRESSSVAGEGDVAGKILSSLFSYAFGHIYAFSDWFSHYLGGVSDLGYIDNFYSYGNYTFQSLFDFFGNGLVFPPGVYEEYFSYNELITTNLYTIFRGLVYDFGSVGALIFMFGCGLVLHTLYYRLLVRKNSWLACAVFIVSIVSFQASFIISLFMARYMYLIFIILFIFLYVNDIIFEKNKRI